MTFRIVKPWFEWLVETKVGGELTEAKIDSGSSLTVLGREMVELLGIDKANIATQNYIEYTGITGAGGQAFKVKINCIPLGKETIPVSHVYVPFEFCENGTKYRFISPRKYLIGTDVLNLYNTATTFNKSYLSNEIRSFDLNLTPHNLEISGISPKEKHLSQLSAKVEELAVD
jgi:hypothetical protein